MALAPNRCVQLKKLFSETHPQIKFEDGSVKRNTILIACTGLKGRRCYKELKNFESFDKSVDVAVWGWPHPNMIWHAH